MGDIPRRPLRRLGVPRRHLHPRQWHRYISRHASASGTAGNADRIAPPYRVLWSIFLGTSVGSTVPTAGRVASDRNRYVRRRRAGRTTERPESETNMALWCRGNYCMAHSSHLGSCRGRIGDLFRPLCDGCHAQEQVEPRWLASRFWDRDAAVGGTDVAPLHRRDADGPTNLADSSVVAVVGLIGGNSLCWRRGGHVHGTDQAADTPVHQPCNTVVGPDAKTDLTPLGDSASWFYRAGPGTSCIAGRDCSRAQCHRSIGWTRSTNRCCVRRSAWSHCLATSATSSAPTLAGRRHPYIALLLRVGYDPVLSHPSDRSLSRAGVEAGRKAVLVGRRHSSRVDGLRLPSPESVALVAAHCRWTDCHSRPRLP